MTEDQILDVHTFDRQVFCCHQLLLHVLHVKLAIDLRSMPPHSWPLHAVQYFVLDSRQVC